MNASYYQLVVEGNICILKNLLHLLDKAVEHAIANKIEERALLDARLFPDMWPLIRQIRMVCDSTRNTASMLTGKDAPKFDDNETSFAELKARISNSISYLNAFGENDFRDSAEREVRLPWIPDIAYRGEVFLLRFAIPNIYFHMTTVYNLLRHNGVPIGKADYLGKVG